MSLPSICILASAGILAYCISNTVAKHQHREVPTEELFPDDPIVTIEMHFTKPVEQVSCFMEKGYIVYPDFKNDTYHVGILKNGRPIDLSQESPRKAFYMDCAACQVGI